MPAPILYSFRRCPYAIRARLALRKASIDCELREVVLRDKPPELLAISPKGTVPVLLLPDGHVLEQSLDIMLWALVQHDPEGWLTQAPLADAHALIGINDTRFKPLLDRYKYPERHTEATQPDWRDQAVDVMLADLDRRLRCTHHLLSTLPSLADMAILPFVRQFAQVDRIWWDGCALTALRQWLDSLTHSPLFETVMAKT